MPKNVMKLLKPSRNVGRSAFDLSHRHLVTANFGELLPITCIETVPGDYIEMRVSDLLRAMPLVTSPFLRAKQHIDVWFTSYDDLWHNFEQFITQKDQPVSSALKSSKYCPNATLNTLFACAQGKDPSDLQDRIYPISTDVVGRDYTPGALKLLDMLGYGENYLQPLVDGADKSPAVNIWRILQYNKIWYDEYRQKYFDTGNRGISHMTGASPAYLFNVDDLPCDTAAKANIMFTNGGLSQWNIDRVHAMLQMRYRCWKKDLYTGALPNTQFGSVSTVPLTGHDIISITGFTGKDTGRWTATDGTPLSVYSSNSNVATNSDVLADTTLNTSIIHDHVLDPNKMSISYGGGQTFDILSFRKSEALQIWRENALRAGNRVSDNMRAHYGDDAEYNDHRSIPLGSVSTSLNISDIDAHAQTGSDANQQLADVAGKGLSSANEFVFKFKAKKFGCIMVMFSMLPEAEYESNGVDRMNQLVESEDYFVSEYQNTGLEAISKMTFLRQATGVHGYAPKYWGYKTKLDKCFEGFKMNQPFASWASPKTDISTVSISGLATFYVNPMLFFRNFGIAVTGTPGAETTTEQFLCDVYFNVDAVRAMSVVGLPQNL